MRCPALVLVPLVLLAVAAPVASAATPPRTVRMISGGTSSAFAPSFGQIAKDGSRVVFYTAEPLLPSDHNTVSDVYARDADGTLKLISTGGAGASAANSVGISADGDRVWYATAGADLPTDTDTTTDIYERRRNGTLRQISAGNGNFGAQFTGASSDGDHVVSSTIEAVPGTGDFDAQNDFYDRRADGSIRLLTPGTAQTVQAFGNRVALSADGSRLSFFTSESLTAADVDATTDSYSVPTTGGPYILETPGTTIATFATVNRGGDRAWIQTTEALLPADTDTASDVYERLKNGTLRLVTGGTANVAAFFANATDDGSHIVFSTTEALLPADVNGTTDLYDRHADGTLHLVSGGTAGTASLWALDNVGTAVFSTDQALVPGDADGVSDIYARLANGQIKLLTSGTATAIFPTGYVENTPADWARVTFTAPDIPGTGDSNGVGDLYEVLPTGEIRLVGPAIPGGTGVGIYDESRDGARLSFGTSATVPGTGDTDTAFDFYEADFAVPVISGVPTMSGAGRVGRTQTCSTLTATGEGLTNTFGWFRDATAILGASAKTYKPVLADAGHRLRCRFIAANGVGTDTADSASRKVPPAAKSLKMGGFPIVGTKLSCTSFAGATRTTYKWKRGSTTVRGRTKRTYSVGRSDLGKRVSCSAVAKNGTLSTSVSQRVTVPRQCKVPSVRGLTPAAAKTKLGNAGCRSTTKRISGSGVPVGRVLGTSPGKGKKRANGARITINVRK